MFLILICVSLFLPSNSHEKNYVKLTMKQNLIMNQVLSTYSLDHIENPTCRKHLEQFKSGLRAFEVWALNMFDSSSKIPAGILSGNLVEFGSFKQCIRIKHGEIEGKHCMIKITPPLHLIKKILSFRNVSEKRFPKVRLIVEKAVFLWSVCVPKSCSALEVLRHFNKTISELTLGLNLTVSLEEKYCLSLEKEAKMGLTQYFSLFFLSVFVAASLVSTVLEITSPLRSNLIISFSLYSNYRKIIAKRRSNDLDSIHGLRFLSTCYVVVGHRFLMAMYTPVINGLEILDWVLNYSSAIIIGGTICVDTFFMISAVLVSMGFFKFVEKNRFNLITFYLYRYFRITPALGIVVLIYATLVQFLGSGPLWTDTCEAHLTPCRYYWWSTLLHIQSYINPNTLCVLQTWYLTCEMLFYYFSPIILVPLWKNQTWGVLNFVVFYILSVSVSFYLAWLNKYEGGMPVTNQLLQTHYFQNHYITPHTRAPTYLLGLIFGYYLHKLDDKRIKISFFVNSIGWITASTLMLLSVFGSHVFQLENHAYDQLESSAFLAFSRSAWIFGVIWIIWACVNGYGGLINAFLSLFPFRVLGRISYGMFLLHMLLQLFKNGANKMPIYFSNFAAIYDSFADLFVIILASFLFTLFYELPLTNLAEIFFKMKKVSPN